MKIGEVVTRREADEVRVRARQSAPGGLAGSMTDGCECHQNALAERVNGNLKNACLPQRPADLEQARRMVRELVDVCNRERPHRSLQLKTPDAVHRASLGGETPSWFAGMNVPTWFGMGHRAVREGFVFMILTPVFFDTGL